MNQTVCNNQPPSILLVDIPYQRTLVTGAHAEVIADNLRAKGCPAIHHR